MNGSKRAERRGRSAPAERRFRLQESKMASAAAPYTASDSRLIPRLRGNRDGGDSGQRDHGGSDTHAYLLLRQCSVSNYSAGRRAGCLGGATCACRHKFRPIAIQRELEQTLKTTGLDFEMNVYKSLLGHEGIPSLHRRSRSPQLAYLRPAAYPSSRLPRPICVLAFPIRSVEPEVLEQVPRRRRPSMGLVSS
jgi:hypothetical protein